MDQVYNYIDYEDSHWITKEEFFDTEKITATEKWTGALEELDEVGRGKGHIFARLIFATLIFALIWDFVSLLLKSYSQISKQTLTLLIH